MAQPNTPPTFNPAPLVVLASAFAVGITAAKLFNVPVAAISIAAILLLAIAVILRGGRVAVAVVIAAFACIGAISLEAERRGVGEERIRTIYDSSEIESGASVEVEGTLAGFPEAAFDGMFLTVEAYSLTDGRNTRAAAGRVRIFVPATESISQISNLKFGSRIRAACDLSREGAYQNPGVTSRREILDRQGIDARCSVKSALLIEHIADESVFIPLAAIYGWRASWINIFRENLDHRTAGVMIASLLGNKYFLDRETAELFREGGTFHILVISGLHITFIGGVLYFFIGRLTRNRWARFLTVNIVLAGYTIAVGADVPVVRAAVMFAILSFGSVIFRQRNLLNSLAASAILLLGWRPSDLFNPSFQLTFVSVGAIVAIAFPLLTKLRQIGTWMPDAHQPFPPNVNWTLRRFAEAIYWNPATWQIESGRQVWSGGIEKRPYFSSLAGTTLQRYIRYLFEGVSVSLIVQVAMLPLLILYFHTVSFSAVLLNIWVGAFIALESFAAVVGTLIVQVSLAIATPFFLLAEASNAAMLALPRLISAEGLTRIRVPAYSDEGRIVYVLFAAPMAALAVLVFRWDPFDLKRFAGLRARAVPAVTAVAILMGVMIFHPFSVSGPDGKLQVDFLDVGQGDSALVTFPNGTTMLIDAGGKLNFRNDADEGEQPFEPDVQGIGELVVSQVLWAKGHSSVDYLVATHPDLDHIEGFTDIAANFDVGEILVERRASESPDFVEVAAAARRRNVPIRFVSEGTVMHIDGATVEVLSPGEGHTWLTSDNDRSLVIKITYGERSFLFTGDIESAAETRLAVPRADVVKAAHHGSRTSSTPSFVDAVSAEVVVVPAPRRSRFGHPHPEVVERWRASGAAVFMTGTSGMISVSTDGKGLSVKEFVKNKR